MPVSPAGHAGALLAAGVSAFANHAPDASRTAKAEIVEARPSWLAIRFIFDERLLLEGVLARLSSMARGVLDREGSAYRRRRNGNVLGAESKSRSGYLARSNCGLMTRSCRQRAGNWDAAMAPPHRALPRRPLCLPWQSAMGSDGTRTRPAHAGRMLANYAA
jgi:hypothetical protein